MSERDREKWGVGKGGEQETEREGKRIYRFQIKSYNNNKTTNKMILMK